MAILTQWAGGNGGGYRYGVQFTGSVAPFEPTEVEHVQIIDEQLSIALGDESADVEVRYVMKNVINRRVKVTFGFPIEAGRSGLYRSYEETISAGETERRLTKKEREQLTTEAGRNCADYVVQVDGKKARHRHQVEPFAAGAVGTFHGSEVLDGVIGWMVSSLAFMAGQERKVTIRYRAAYDRVGYTVSDDAHHSPPVFRYRLSTGGVWAGPILKGRVKVTLTGADPRWTEIKKPAGRFKRDSGGGGSWVWAFENLEPTLADDIEITTGPPSHEYSRNGTVFINTGDRWQLRHQDFKAVASSTLEPDGKLTYGAENVIGPDYVTQWKENYSAWSEGVDGEGIGETIDLTVGRPLPLTALRIHPGYGKSDHLFNANGRPATLRITLNEEHTFLANLRDSNQAQDIEIVDYSKPVKSVQLKIEKVYSGNKFTDTCISDIRLVANLAKKPKFQGAR